MTIHSPQTLCPVFSPTYRSPEKRKAKRQLERYEQRMHSKKKRLEYSQRPIAVEALEMGNSSHSVVLGHIQGHTKEVATQTDVVSTTNSSTTTLNDDHYCSVATMTDISGRYVEALEEESRATGNRLQVKAHDLDAPWSENALKSDENKVKFCTGLPSFTTLMVIYNFVSSQVQHGSKAHALSRFEEFIATIMKFDSACTIKISHTDSVFIKQLYHATSGGRLMSCLLD